MKLNPITIEMSAAILGVVVCLGLMVWILV